MNDLVKRKVYSLFNSDAAKERLREYLQYRNSYPFVAVIHPTMVCNHRCDFCNYFHVIDHLYGKEARPTKFIETAYMLRLLSELYECGVQSIIFSGGGEPLLHRDFGQIARHALEIGFNTSLYTNLDVVMKEDVLATMPRFKSVTVNVNTSDPDLYGITRGAKGDFERVGRNLSLLAECGVKLEATVIIRDNTAHRLRETIEWLKGYNVRCIKISPAFMLQYDDGIGATEATLREMVTISREYGQANEVRLIEPVEPVVKDKSGRVFCSTVFFDITIGADCKIYPCCMRAYLDDYVVVDLHKYISFKEAWNSPERIHWQQHAKLECVTCWFGAANDLLKSQKTADKM